MKTVSADVTSALAAGRALVGWALRLDLGDGTVYTISTSKETLSYGGKSYTFNHLVVTALPDNANPTLARCTVILADLSGAIRADIRDGSIFAAQVKLYRLIASDVGITPSFVEVFTGRVEAPGVEAGRVELACGPAEGLWAILGPPYFTAKCSYKSTSQCAFAASCDQTWAACGVNAQTAIFGGYRRLPAPGTRVSFMGGAVTLSTSGGE